MLFFHPVLELFFDFAARRNNETLFGFRLNVLVNLDVPLGKLLEQIPNIFKVSCLSELFKRKFYFEFVDVVAKFKCFCVLFDIRE